MGNQQPSIRIINKTKKGVINMLDNPNDLNYPLEFFEVFVPIEQDKIEGIYPNRYEVSNFGRIFDKKLNRFLKLTPRPDNYIAVSLNVYGEPKTFLLHRIVGMYFVPGDQSLIINHLDGDKSNPFFMNLEWATYSENNVHAFANDLNVKGEDSPKAIITEAQAEMICRHLDEHKLSYAEIALACGVDSPDASALISTIYKGVAWRLISQKYNFSQNDYKTGRYRMYNRHK